MQKAQENGLFQQKRGAVAAIIFSIFLVISCTKEYSYEAAPADPAPVESVVENTIVSCAACTSTANALADSSWQLTIDNTVYCGRADKTVIPLGRTLFTFFGVSACSADSGFVASVYLENASLTGDLSEARARLSCYYYGGNSPWVYISLGPQPLQLTITRYIHSTGEAWGIFSGQMADATGVMKAVKNGRFRIRL